MDERIDGTPSADPAALVTAALNDKSADCRIRTTQFHSVYHSLAEGLRGRGMSGGQITDALWAHLSATCPECGWGLGGDDLGSLWMTWGMGSDQVVSLGHGRTRRFGKGGCPNESCPSEETVLRWDAHPADDLSPLSPLGGDAAAIKAHWRKSASEWWKTETGSEALCAKCWATIPRGEGYHSPATHGDLVCEKCTQRRLSPDSLAAWYRDRASGPRQELRTARQSYLAPENQAG